MLPRRSSQPRTSPTNFGDTTQATKEHFAFVDLVDELQKLPKPEAATLFIPESFAGYYLNIAHHYSNYGNEYVAKKVYRQLISIPEVSARLGQIHDAPVREVKADAR